MPSPLDDPLVYCNGSWVRQSQAAVPFMDSGFWYGDGLFETLLVENGRLFRANQHLARMKDGLAMLQMRLPVPSAEVIGLMEELVRRNSWQRTLLRLMCTRGTISGAPWEFKGPANLYIGLRFPDADPPLPVRVWFTREEDYPISRSNPAIKSMTYLGNMLAIRAAVSQGAFEPVFVNREGLITECAIRNIFFVQNGILRTPDLSLGILPGVTRELIIELANKLDLRVDTAPIARDAVDGMDEAFISSTGIGIFPCTWDGFQPGEYAVTQRLRVAVQAQVRKETGAS